MNTVPELHRTYQQLTGFVLTLSYMREWAWAQFIKRGHTEKELVTVVTWLRGEIRKGNRNPGALKYRNLIEDPDRFEEELGLATMRDRQFKERSKIPEGKRDALKATGRPETYRNPKEYDEPDTAKPVSELIADLRRAAGMEV